MTEKEDPTFVERFTVRMPDGMRYAIAERAKANGRSMNSEIVQILNDALTHPGNEVSSDEAIHILMSKMVNWYSSNYTAIERLANLDEKQIKKIIDSTENKKPT